LIKINNIRDYSLGKSSFPTVILVATIFNTYVSARASIADIGLVYSSGLVNMGGIIKCDSEENQYTKFFIKL
jgi:Na+/proline symporter